MSISPLVYIYTTSLLIILICQKVWGYIATYSPVGNSAFYVICIYRRGATIICIPMQKYEVCVHAIFVIKNCYIREHLKFRDQCNFYSENLKREYIKKLNATWSFQDHPAVCLVMEWVVGVTLNVQQTVTRRMAWRSIVLEAVNEFEELQSLPVNVDFKGETELTCSWPIEQSGTNHAI